MKQALWLRLALLLLLPPRNGGSERQEDLYKLLGVSRVSTAQDIKRAYRRKARDTHPDKRTDISPEQAAEEFHKVVHAFEILSDESSRKRYDRTGSTSQTTRTTTQGTYYTNFWRRPVQRQKKKDRLEVKRAMSRVMHIVSLSQLKTVMLDEEGLLERNLLLMFITPDLDRIAHDDITFPYPFAHMSDQGIWWEDLLQTCEIRFQQSNELTHFFDIPEADVLSKSKQPITLFGRRGQPLNKNNFARIQTRDYNQWTRWVWKQMEVTVIFVNNHPHPVEAFWLHGNAAKQYNTLAPGEHFNANTMLSHEWWFRDARVDTFPSAPNRKGNMVEETMVAIFKMTNDTSPQTIHIEAKTCLDLSGHCAGWKKKGKCNRNQQFMKEYCRMTCRFCSEKNDTINMMEMKKARQQHKAAQRSWKVEF